LDKNVSACVQGSVAEMATGKLGESAEKLQGRRSPCSE
jgi:hypothetical protein